MEPITGVGILLVVVVVLVTFMSVRDQRNKKRIDAEIRRVGGEPVEISFQFVGYDRDNQHYNVQFADLLGRKHNTRAKVNIWNSNLYWQQTPAELLSDVPDQENDWSRLGADADSSKEQIIDDLVAENERLRKQLMAAESLNGDFKGAS